jgi:hypothetical protein
MLRLPHRILCNQRRQLDDYNLSTHSYLHVCWVWNYLSLQLI